MSEIFTQKMCTRCQVRKPVAEFWKKKDNRDGLRSQCKSCTSESSKVYRTENREKEQERHKKYNHENCDRLKARARERHAENSDEINARKRVGYSENREKRLPVRKAYRERTKCSWQSFARTRWSYINKRTVNGSCPRWDDKRHVGYLELGVRIEMTREEFREWCQVYRDLIESMYLEAEESGNRSLIPSIDRIDSSGHYSTANIQILSVGENSRKAALRNQDPD